MQVQEEYQNGLHQDDLWYDIYKENEAYCGDGVRVLRLCFMKSFHACQATTEIMLDTVGLVPHKGYLQKDIQSKMAKTWLAFLDTCYLEGKLHYAGKDAWEKKIYNLGGLYKVDGFLEEENTV